MRIAFVGFGLIAGSIAHALRVAPEPRWRAATLAAWSPSGRGPMAAARDGVIDVAAATLEDVLRAADLVILGAPPLELIGLVNRIGGPLRGVLPPGAVLTDTGSTKVALMSAAERAGVRLTGGHPMAGREQAGYGAASADLFVDRPWIVVPGLNAHQGDTALVEDLARACRARPVSMDAAEHDTATAAISHLPLVAAAALVEAVAGAGDRPRPGWDVASGLAAGGWASSTRLARGDVAMGAGIAATNAGPLAKRIRDYIGALEDWLAELERAGGPDPERLVRRLRAARERLEEGEG